MENRIMCAGIGGQGILTLGMLLAEAAASQGKNVTYIPEYGGAMRGGDSTVKIKISDEEIINPFMEEYSILVALDENMLKRFIGGIEEDGIIVVEEGLVQDIPEKAGVTVLKVPAVKLADEIGNARGMSLVVAGVIIAVTKMFPFDVACEAVTKYFEGKHLPVEKNLAAFVKGYEFANQLA